MCTERVTSLDIVYVIPSLVDVGQNEKRVLNKELLSCFEMWVQGTGSERGLNIEELGFFEKLSLSISDHQYNSDRFIQSKEQIIDKTIQY